MIDCIACGQGREPLRDHRIIFSYLLNMGGPSGEALAATMATCPRGCAPTVRLCQKLNRLKTLDDDMMATSLKRCLSTLDLTLMGVGGMGALAFMS
ncbi:hypothetical protein INR49_004556 [Caranx melampygus]|nr:hypothetical protein INR49_004556 [Caranx melampygus]